MQQNHNVGLWGGGGGGAQSWNIHFGLALSDWELESMDLLFDTLYANIPREEGPDCFKLTENG